MKPNDAKSHVIERYCKLTTTEMLIFGSKTSSQLNFKRPLTRIPLENIVSVELVTEKLQVRHYLQTGSVMSNLSAKKKKTAMYNSSEAINSNTSNSR